MSGPDVTITWKIYGQRRVANDLRHWAREFPRVIDRTIGDFSRERAEHLRDKPYPPERMGQTYRRTFNLKRSWSHKRVKAAVWQILNLVEYAGWVVDEQYQAWMHRGRWWIFQKELRPAPDLTNKLTEALNGVIHG